MTTFRTSCQRRTASSARVPSTLATNSRSPSPLPRAPAVNVAEASHQARFTEVFVPYLVDAFRLARWLAGSRADAEDIVQEASMRAFKNIRGFSGGNPRAWVLTIVRNTSYSWLAKNRPKDVVLSDDLDKDHREQIEQGGTQEMQTPETVLIAKKE